MVVYATVLIRPGVQNAPGRHPGIILFPISHIPHPNEQTQRQVNQPPNPPIKRDRLRRGNQGVFTGFGRAGRQLMGNPLGGERTAVPS
jgi:hypothetical protein